MVSVYPTQKGGLGGGYSFGTPIVISDVRGGGAVPYFRGGPTQFRPPANKGGYKPPAPANEATKNWWRELGRFLAVSTALTTQFWPKPGADGSPDANGGFPSGPPTGYEVFATNTPHVNQPADSGYDPSVFRIVRSTSVFETNPFNMNAHGQAYSAATGQFHWMMLAHKDDNLGATDLFWVYQVYHRLHGVTPPFPLEWPLTDPVVIPLATPGPVLAPSADPWAVPINQPMPRIVAVPFPLVRNAPGQSPLGDPYYNGEPGWGAAPVPFGAPGTVIVYGPNGAVAAAPGMIPRRPPGKNERERKTNPVAAWVYAGLSFVTESTDAVDAVWQALPGDAKTRIKGQRTTPQQKLEDIIENLDRLDVSQAVVNLILEALEDRLWAAGGKLTKQANQRDGRIPGWAAGPAI